MKHAVQRDDSVLVRLVANDVNSAVVLRNAAGIANRNSEQPGEVDTVDNIVGDDDDRLP